MRRACFAAVFAVAGFLLANPARLEAQTRVAIDGDDIGGVVTGPHLSLIHISEPTRPY